MRPGFEHYLAETYARRWQTLRSSIKARLRRRRRPPRMGKDLLPRVAARLKAAMART